MAHPVERITKNRKRQCEKGGEDRLVLCGRFAQLRLVPVSRVAVVVLIVNRVRVLVLASRVADVLILIALAS